MLQSEISGRPTSLAVYSPLDPRLLLDPRLVLETRLVYETQLLLEEIR